MTEPEQSEKDLFGSFKGMFQRLWEVQSRFRPGRPFRWRGSYYTKTPMAARKVKRRRVNKAARIARRQNRRS